MSTCQGAPAPHLNCPHGERCDWEPPEQCGATGKTRGGWDGFCFRPKGHDGPHMDVGID